MILCHIVGINNKIKESFLKEIHVINNSINIIDIDELSKKIIYEKEYNMLYKEYLDSSENNLTNKNKSQNKLQNLSRLSLYWKNRVKEEIEKLISGDYNILIGMITFYLDLRVKVNLTAEIINKFFINSNTETHIKNLIEHNIETYKKDIIDSKFPLKYLDYNFLKSQREQIRDTYMMRDYKLKSYDDILQFIKNKFSLGKMDPVYFASFKRYEGKIDFISNTIVGYNDKWLSLISLFPRSKFKRGVTFKDNQMRPFIKETGPLNMSELNKCCYLYEMIPTEKVDEHRYLIEDNNFIKRYYVSNIKSELDMYNTIFEKY